MVRKFNSGGHISLSVGACGPIQHQFTMAGIVYLPSNANQYFFSANPGSPGNCYAVGCEQERLTLYKNGGSRGSLFPTGEWVFIGVKKGTGIEEPKFFIYRYGAEEWLTIKGATSEDGDPMTSLRLGQWGSGEQLLGKMAAIAVWDGLLLDEEIEEMATAPSIMSWLEHEPTGMWMFNQAEVSEAVLDQTAGGADQTEEANTEVVEEEPPIPYEAGEEKPGPKVKTEPASNIHEHDATISGEVDAGTVGPTVITKFKMEWGTSPALGNSTPESEFEGEGSRLTNEEITGLTPGTKYYFRIWASNEEGTNTGSIRNFETEPEGEVEEPANKVLVKVDGALVEGRRYVKASGGLVPV